MTARTCKFCGQLTDDPEHWLGHLSTSEAADLASIGIDPDRVRWWA